MDTQKSIIKPSYGFFRCGWCGHPTNKDGQPLTINECKQLTDKQLNSAELLNGDCCPPQQEREAQD